MIEVLSDLVSKASNHSEYPTLITVLMQCINSIHISQADNVLRNDSTDSEFLGIEPRNDGNSLVGVFTARRGDFVT